MMPTERPGEPFRFDYPDGQRPVSVAAVPFSQVLGRGERIEAVREPYFLADDRRRNGEAILRKEEPR